MAIALDPQTIHEHPDDGTTFLLRPLTAREFSRHVVPGLSQGGDSGRFLLGESGIDILRCGLAGWRGFRDASGKDVQFSTEGTGPRAPASDESIDRLTVPLRMALVGEVLRLSRIGEDDRRD